MPEGNSTRPTREEEVKMVEGLAAKLGSKRFGHEEAVLFVNAYHILAEERGYPELVISFEAQK